MCWRLGLSVHPCMCASFENYSVNLGIVTKVSGKKIVCLPIKGMTPVTTDLQNVSMDSGHF